MKTAETLAEIKNDFGFVPNLLKEMSKSPAAPLVYVKGNKIMEAAQLTPGDQQAVQLVVSVYNECAYCTSAHSRFLESTGTSHEDVIALRNGEYPNDERLAAITFATRTILEKRGRLSTMDLRNIENLGIDEAEFYEIITHVGLKTIANYAVHVIHPEIDKAFEFVE